MRKSEQVASWAVYQATILGQAGPNVVCGQGEWEAIEQAQPGLHRLVRGGIPNEGEAERLARGASGDDKRASRKKVALVAGLAAAEADEGDSNGDGREDGPVMLPFACPPQEVAAEDAPGEPAGGRMESA